MRSSPRPSTSIARRETKCRMRLGRPARDRTGSRSAPRPRPPAERPSRRRPGSAPASRKAARPSAASRGGRASPSGSRRRAFSTATVSPTRTSLRARSSRLWSVARLTTVPARRTGVNSATGVRTPVRPDLHDDVRHDRRGLLGRELVRERPARGLRGLAEAPLVGHGVHLQDDAVRLERQVVALRPPFVEEGEDPLHVGDERRDGG